jgi:hypothetical protein
LVACVATHSRAHPGGAAAFRLQCCWRAFALVTSRSGAATAAMVCRHCDRTGHRRVHGSATADGAEAFGFIRSGCAVRAACRTVHTGWPVRCGAACPGGCTSVWLRIGPKPNALPAARSAPFVAATFIHLVRRGGREEESVSSGRRGTAPGGWHLSCSPPTFRSAMDGWMDGRIAVPVADRAGARQLSQQRLGARQRLRSAHSVPRLTAPLRTDATRGVAQRSGLAAASPPHASSGAAAHGVRTERVRALRRLQARRA